MPTIDPDLIPSVNAGGLLSRLTTDPNLVIRWLTGQDPAYAAVLNRPTIDAVVQILVLAKSLDNISIKLGSSLYFPYLEQPQIDYGTANTDVPLSLVYDMHISVPQKWENVRLVRVKRMSGDNATVSTGIIRFVFAANETDSTTEVALFTADYRIDSSDTYQLVRIDKAVATTTETVVIDSGEQNTVDGFIIFKTLDVTTDAIYDSFITGVAPPGATDEGSDGFYSTPTTYDVIASTINPTISHGTGLLVNHAWNCIPDLATSVNTWVGAFNYPFEDGVNLTSSSHASTIIPDVLFKEFSIVAPSGDKPTGDVTGTTFPVYVSRITRDDASSDQITFYFSTYNVESPTTTAIEFAKLTLLRANTAGTIVKIIPNENLFPTKAGDADYMQGFGTGHVVLSSKWGTSSEITDFFDSLLTIVDSDPAAEFTESSTRLSSFAVSRVPQYTPTSGQAEALLSTTPSTSPSSTARFITEADQGEGTQVDFTNAGLADATVNHPAIERYGYTGSLAHRIVKLIVDSSDDTLNYETDILPRLTILFGRAPVFGDVWFDGTRMKTWTGDTWLS